ncbi:protein of unknown function [Maridesulfovibrio hydrothermalis AM13 = DSM 14728]|uniref:Uncharacterized protein n=1 Tax=Maridesulfovibrio hydrothermalis AM13 = DSM 14728 TaxID=1121451 RepID=L0RGN6_9BACT|nr:protein of unknown function [Maridesulfovibrio hydrothermalis AM13 = DSM 14728]
MGGISCAFVVSCCRSIVVCSFDLESDTFSSIILFELALQGIRMTDRQIIMENNNS